jgi:hypothetical protein
LRAIESLFSVSETGALASQDVASKPRQLVWFARQGTQLGLVGQAGAQSRVTLAPDAKRVALVRNDPQRGNRDIWLVELALGRFVSRANSSASASMAESIPYSSGV